MRARSISAFAVLFLGCVGFWIESNHRPASLPIRSSPGPQLESKPAPTVEVHATKMENPSSGVLNGIGTPQFSIKEDAAADAGTPSDHGQSIVMSQLQQRPDICLRPDALRQLSQGEVARLMGLYESINDPSQKRGLIWALGFCGSDLAVDILLQAASTEYAGRRLDLKQSGNANLAFSILVVVGERSTAARDYLIAGSRVDYWNGREPWEVEPALEENFHWRLAGSCISALGMTGSEFAFQAVTTIRESDTHLFQGKVAGNMVSSRFYASMRRDYGAEFLFDEICYDGIVMLSAFRVWKQTTDEGRNWAGWASEVTGMPFNASRSIAADQGVFEDAISRWPR